VATFKLTIIMKCVANTELVNSLMTSSHWNRAGRGGNYLSDWNQLVWARDKSSA